MSAARDLLTIQDHVTAARQPQGVVRVVANVPAYTRVCICACVLWCLCVGGGGEGVATAPLRQVLGILLLA
jgi:hypothetical protein